MCIYSSLCLEEKSSKLNLQCQCHIDQNCIYNNIYNSKKFVSDLIGYIQLMNRNLYLLMTKMYCKLKNKL